MQRNIFHFVMPLIAILVIDQFTKYWSQPIVINTGVSFGLFSSGITTLALVMVLALVALSYGTVFFRISPIASGVFFGASSSNILDRILFGGVRDFLPVPILGVRNNLADWGIILSLLWIFWNLKKASSTKTTISS